MLLMLPLFRFLLGRSQGSYHYFIIVVLVLVLVTVLVLVLVVVVVVGIAAHDEERLLNECIANDINRIESCPSSQ